MMHFLNIFSASENNFISAILQKSYKSLAAALLIRALVFAAKISIAATVLTFIFFLVGHNVRKHPKEFQMIVERGHRLGNHTFNHIRGFEYRSKNYLANTDKANELIHTNLFRPPHGHMRWMQYMVLRHKYQIVMWDLVTRDYSNKLNGRQVLRKVKHYVRNGSIITFHDSIKAEKNMKYALPRAIEWLLEQGYEFKVFD